MKRIIMLVVTLAFMLACFIPAIAQDQKGTPAAPHKFKIGDKVTISSGTQTLDGEIVDVVTIHSKANNKDTISYTAEIKNIFNFNEGDPRVAPK